MPYASNGDIDLYYEVHGQQDASDTIVFAHGAGGNALSWWQQVPEFASTHRVIVFDHRGFGRSRCAPEDQIATRFEGDLVAILDAVDVSSAVIVCQSMGGWTGVRTAVKHPDRVRAVLLGNTPGAVQNASVKDNWAQLAKRIGEGGGLVNRALSQQFAARHPERALLYQQISAFNSEAQPNVQDESVHVSPDRVVDSGVPFLVLTSDLDPLFPPEVLESVARDIGAPSVRVNGAGHSTYFEKPEAFNAVLSEFVRRLPS